MSYVKQKILILCLSICCISTVVRGESISGIISRHKQQKTDFAILALDAATGKVLYTKNADKAMIPASNMKLVTTGAALHYLGSAYVFRTQAGLLGDSLVIIGAGDPLLGEPKLDSADPRSAGRMFEEIAAAVKQAGLTSLDNVIIDVSFFDSNRVHPSWPREQLNQWYACETSGLNFYNNCIRITAERNNNKPVLKMEPANSFVRLDNQLKMISQGSSAVGAYRNSVPNHLLVKGRLNQQAGFDVAIEHPPSLFASILGERLRKSGIEVRGKILQQYVKDNRSIRIIKTFETPIGEVLARCNKDSLGLAAECLIKTISAENTQGRINGEWPHGLTLVARYLQSLGVDAGQFSLDDGSGLSRKNQLSPTALVAVLKDIYNSHNRPLLMDSLAVGGQDGTINRYFRQAPYRGQIFGKTGYINGVRSFSGVCKTPRGDILFSILTEGGNSTTRTCINDITEAIYDGRY